MTISNKKVIEFSLRQVMCLSWSFYPHGAISGNGSAAAIYSAGLSWFQKIKLAPHGLNQINLVPVCSNRLKRV